MTYYFKNGNRYRPTAEENVDMRSKLPAGNYVIKQDQFGNLFFETVGNFTLPSKRYGDNPRYCERILSTFMARDNATGVMLAGEKGSGKSLLAKTVSVTAASMDIPTIIINAPWHGDAFNTLIQGLEQPAIVLFDEFEKVYDREKQEDILTLLDGVFPSKKLFMLTCNDKWRVDQHMRNRPGRIFYMIDFGGLTEDFIAEYCNDNLLNKSHIPALCKVTTMFTEFNFDMLKAVVEEMNRYDEPPRAALQMLNVRPEFDSTRPTWTMLLTKGTEVVKLYSGSEFVGNPLSDEVEVHFTIPNPEYDPNNENSEKFLYDSMELGSEHLHMIQPNEVKMEKNGYLLTLTRKQSAPTPHWLDAF